MIRFENDYGQVRYQPEVDDTRLYLDYGFQGYIYRWGPGAWVTEPGPKLFRWKWQARYYERRWVRELKRIDKRKFKEV